MWKNYSRKNYFRKCSVEECSKCCEQIKRDEYNEERWVTDRDGYLICGTCYEKLSGEICTNCFCKICYVSADEYCACNSSEQFFLEKNEMCAVWIKLFNWKSHKKNIMLIIIKLKKMILILKICFYQIL